MMKKMTLPRLRSLYGFDLPQLVWVTQLTTVTVYRAMLRQPIRRDEAIELMKGLQILTGIVWTSETLDIVLWDDQLLLWVVRASAEAHNETLGDEYTLVYARDRSHALELSQTWWQLLKGSHPRLLLTPQREGFHIGSIHIPGYYQPEQAETP